MGVRVQRRVRPRRMIVGGSSGSMPTGASGIWFMGDYDAGSVPSSVPGGPAIVINATAGLSGGVLDMSAAGGTNYGTIDWPDTFDISQPHTIISACERFSTGSGDADNHVWLSDKDNADWRVGSVAAQKSGIFVNETPFAMLKSQSGGPELFDRVGNGMGVFTHRYDGSDTDGWIDSAKLLKSIPATGAIGSIVVGDMYFNRVNSATGGIKYAALAFYRRALTDNEIRQAVTYIKGRTGIVSSPARYVVFIGDSICYGVGASDNIGYTAMFAPNANPRVRGTSYAVGGTGIDELPVADVLAFRAAVPSAAKVIVHIHIGSNNIVTSMSAATFLGKFDTLCDTLNAAGCTVIGSTILDRMAVLGEVDQATFRSVRAAINTGLRARVGTKIVACSDFASDPTMGPDGAPANATYFDDMVHPESAGYALLEPYVRADINAA